MIESKGLRKATQYAMIIPINGYCKTVITYNHCEPLEKGTVSGMRLKETNNKSE